MATPMFPDGTATLVCHPDRSTLFTQSVSEGRACGGIAAWSARSRNVQLIPRAADRKGMSGAAMPEPRSAVMILVQATWEDQHGTLQTARACMENRSPSGACIRVPARIAAGTKLKIQWRWEEFNGVAKYCRTDGQEYLVGVQRIAAVVPRGAAATTTKTKAPPSPKDKRNS